MNVNNIPLILALDVAGLPNRWINYEQAAYYYAKDLVAWELGDDEYFLRGGIQSATGIQSKMQLRPIIAIRGESLSKRGHFARVPPLTNRALFRRDLNICAYCGIEFHAARLTRDHVMPSSRGGLNAWKNVVTSCDSCNKRKDCRTPEEAHMKLLYVPYEPDRAEYLLLMNRHVLADQMDFLKKQIKNKHSRILMA